MSATENGRGTAAPVDSKQSAPRGYRPTGKDTGIVKSKGTARVPIADGQAMALKTRKPDWLKVRSPGGPNYRRLKGLMRELGLHSVCEEAGCPNIGECWEAGTATFLILGDVCTRACKYCAIAHGMPPSWTRTSRGAWRRWWPSSSWSTWSSPA
jgi:hypothetical protein